MSAIAGIFHRDGQPGCEQIIRQMTQSMIHRGPDGHRTWCSGELQLGHAMLWTTPESLFEVLPMVQSASGLSITADLRIDNREELAGDLGIERPLTDITDTELLLNVYAKWGKACPEKLVGDFAFAIWDQRKQELFCARDPMGVKCLYYFASDKLFAFASEIKALFCVPQIPRRLNETRVLDHLANIFEDREGTFYKDVFRLPAASHLTVSKGHLQISRYWSLDPKRELKLKSDGEYTEAFRDCFVAAVRARIRSAFPVSCALSGGLDSSSIACVARQLSLEAGGKPPLHTISLTFPSFAEEGRFRVDEQKYIGAVLKLGGFQAHFIRADEKSPLTDVEVVHRHLDEPYSAGNLYLHWAMFHIANGNGSRVFLDGLDGDTTISHGFEFLADLALYLKWNRLKREIKLTSKNLKISQKRLFKEYCVKPLAPTWVYSLWRKLHGRPTNAGLPETYVKPEFKVKQNLQQRAKSMVPSKRSCTRSAREKHWEMLNFPLYAQTLEIADKASAAFRIEPRYPFFDRRLIELCLSLPAEQKLGQGWSRWILRKAMQDVLPTEIQWRSDKANLSPNFYRTLLLRDRDLLRNIILDDCPMLDPYLDYPAIRNAYKKLDSDPMSHHDEFLNIFAAVNLGVWLRNANLVN